MSQTSLSSHLICSVRPARFFVIAMLLIYLAASQAAAQITFSNTAPITIPDDRTANPYPSEIVVSGFAAGQSVSKVTVSINDFSHDFAVDVGILLVSPAGVAVNLDGRCGDSSISNVTLTFDDDAAGTLPFPLTSGTYQPSQCNFVSYPQTGSAPPPAAPYNNSLRSFKNSNPNGTWRLYVYDDETPDGGAISGGYSITITTAAATARTFTVNTDSDSENNGCAVGLCTLREAINDANNNLGNDTITFQRAFFSQPRTITLSGTELSVVSNGALTIDNTTPSLVTVSGNNTSRILLNDGVLTVNRLIFTGGNGIGIGETLFNNGGAIYNLNVLTLNQSQVTGNAVSGEGGGISNQRTITFNKCIVSNNLAIKITVDDVLTSGFGGGVLSFNSLDQTVTDVNDSTFFNNVAEAFGTGGGIDNSGLLDITNSTFSGNSTISTGGFLNNGGAIWTSNSAVNIINSTIAGNTTSNSNTISGISASGIYNSGGGTVTLRNTIVAGNVNNSTFPDVSSNSNTGGFASGGNNLIGNLGNLTTFVNGANGDQTGTAAAPLDPLLAPLALNGGSVLTRALLGNSPAVDAGSNVAGIPAVDARGAARLSAVDIGAFELNPAFVAALPFGRNTVAYSAVIAPNSGAFVYTLAAGALPPGLSLSSAAGVVTISGTPTQEGAFNFTLGYTDGVNSGSANYTITIAAATAANVQLGGRVLTSAGRGLRGATVMLSDERGRTRIATTSSFGAYRFADVAAGATYLVQVRSKQYSFAPQLITVTADTGNLDFTAQP